MAISVVWSIGRHMLTCKCSVEMSGLDRIEQGVGNSMLYSIVNS